MNLKTAANMGFALRLATSYVQLIKQTLRQFILLNIFIVSTLTLCSESKKFTLTDTVFEVGQTLTRHLLFQFGATKAISVVDSRSIPTLDSISKFLLCHKSLTIRIQTNIRPYYGGVDAEAKNRSLARNHSKAIVEYFISKGIAKNKLEILSWGGN
jgi:hypothetical protein